MTNSSPLPSADAGTSDRRIAPNDVRLHPLPPVFSDDELAVTSIRRILAEAVTVLGTRQGTLALRDPASDELWTAASVGFDQVYLAATARIPAGLGACGSAVKLATPVVVEDTASDPVFAAYRVSARHGGYRAVVSIPLMDSKDQVVGTVSVHFPEPHRPAPADIEQVAAYARAALAPESTALDPL
jgi:GAF domain-containing protein